MTMTSAAGRVTTVDYDALGHVVAIGPPGVQSMQLHYDTHGPNDSITQGARVTVTCPPFPSSHLTCPPFPSSYYVSPRQRFEYSSGVDPNSELCGLFSL